MSNKLKTALEATASLPEEGRACHLSLLRRYACDNGFSTSYRVQTAKVSAILAFLGAAGLSVGADFTVTSARNCPQVSCVTILDSAAAAEFRNDVTAVASQIVRAKGESCSSALDYVASECKDHPDTPAAVLVPSPDDIHANLRAAVERLDPEVRQAVSADLERAISSGTIIPGLPLLERIAAPFIDDGPGFRVFREDQRFSGAARLRYFRKDERTCPIAGALLLPSDELVKTKAFSDYFVRTKKEAGAYGLAGKSAIFGVSSAALDTVGPSGAAVAAFASDHRLFWTYVEKILSVAIPGVAANEYSRIGVCDRHMFTDGGRSIPVTAVRDGYGDGALVAMLAFHFGFPKNEESSASKSSWTAGKVVLDLPGSERPETGFISTKDYGRILFEALHVDIGSLPEARTVEHEIRRLKELRELDPARCAALCKGDSVAMFKPRHPDGTQEPPTPLSRFCADVVLSLRKALAPDMLVGLDPSVGADPNKAPFPHIVSAVYSGMVRSGSPAFEIHGKQWSSGSFCTIEGLSGLASELGRAQFSDNDTAEKAVILVETNIDCSASFDIDSGKVAELRDRILASVKLRLLCRNVDLPSSSLVSSYRHPQLTTDTTTGRSAATYVFSRVAAVRGDDFAYATEPTLRAPIMTAISHFNSEQFNGGVGSCLVAADAETHRLYLLVAISRNAVEALVSGHCAATGLSPIRDSFQVSVVSGSRLAVPGVGADHALFVIKESVKRAIASCVTPYGGPVSHVYWPLGAVKEAVEAANVLGYNFPTRSAPTTLIA